MALEGKITLAYLPPGYASEGKRDIYENHPDLVRISDLLALDQQQDDSSDHFDDFDSQEEEENDESDGEESAEQQVPITRNKFAMLEADETWFSHKNKVIFP